MNKTYITQPCNGCENYQTFVYVREGHIESLNQNFPIYSCLVCGSEQGDNRTENDKQRDLEKQNPLELNVQDLSQEGGEN